MRILRTRAPAVLFICFLKTYIFFEIHPKTSRIDCFFFLARRRRRQTVIFVHTFNFLTILKHISAIFLEFFSNFLVLNLEKNLKT